MFMKAKRIGEIEILRFIFCSLVIAFHCNTRIVQQFSGVDYQLLCAPKGYMGVEFFFILSGYFMAKSIIKIHAGNTPRGTAYLRFLWGKYLAVLPFQLIAFIPIFVKYCVDKKGFTFDMVLRVLPDLFLVQRSGVAYTDINSVTWYISAMLIAMAVILPFAVRLGDLYLKYAAPLIAFLVYGWLMHKNGCMGNIGTWSFGYDCVWRAIAGINLGIFANTCASVLSKYDYSKKERVFAHILRYVFFAAAIAYMFFLMPKKYEMWCVVLIFFALVLTFVFSSRESKALNGKFAIFLGQMSLPMYLIQIFVIMIIKNYNLQLAPVWIVLIVVAAIFVVSLPIHFLGNALLKVWKGSRFNRMVMGQEPLKKAAN